MATSNELEDVLADFESGVNSDPPPLKLERTQLANATNVTVRGQYARPRPPFNDIQLSAAFDLANTGLFQGLAFYKPDAAFPFLLMVVSGNLYKIEVTGAVTKVNSESTMQSPIAQEHWLWQSEKWVVWNDGINLPVFFNGHSCFRSNGQRQLNSPTLGAYSSTIVGTSGLSTTYQNTVAGGITPPTFTLTLGSPFTGDVGDYVKFGAIQSVKPPGGSGIVLHDGSGNVISQFDFNLEDLGFYFIVESISGNTIDVKLSSGTWPPVQYTGWRYLVSTPIPTVIQQYIPPYSGVLSENLILPDPFDIGDAAVLKLTGNYNGQVGDYVQVGGPTFNYIFKVGTITSPTELAVTSYNVVISSGGSVTVPAGSPVRAVVVNFMPQLPAGKMGAYIGGRNIMILPDGKRFIIGDIQGGSSGTVAEDFRDAVLNVYENNYLRGGGYFSVPGGVGEITAIIGGALLDRALGQGPARIFTAIRGFSLNLPTDRALWAEITDPILPEHIISNGSVSQRATINCNSDILMRALDGWRSEVLGRRDFEAWGNVPQSKEVDKTLRADNQELIGLCSAIVTNNRALMTATPRVSAQGIYHEKLIALNLDPISSLRGKAPSVYDGIWTGRNIFQMVTGIFAGRERAFAAFRTEDGKIGLTELLREEEAIYDDGEDRITMRFDTCSLFRENQGRNRKLLRLDNGEVNVDELEGTVDFFVYYRPDQYPCWTLWNKWTECAQTARAPLPIPENPETLQVQFRPSMGLGTPRGSDCDPSTNRPMREGYTFPIKVVIVGKCRFLGMSVTAAVIPDRKYATPKCCPELVEPTI